MPETIKQFGSYEPTVEYILRPGAYSIIENEMGEIAVVSTLKGVYLPGGGQIDGESLEDAAIREAAEECGLKLRMKQMVGVADELVWSESEGVHFRKRCTFFTAVLVGDGLVSEADHVLHWLMPEAAIERLSHGSHVWAVEKEFGQLWRKV